MQNGIIYDWLSFTIKLHSLSDVIKLLKLDDYKLETIYGFNGYKKREYVNGISIHHEHTKNNDIWVELSGKGCRFYEVFCGPIDELVKKLVIMIDTDLVNITRLDIAYDIFDNIADMDYIYNDTVREYWTSKFRTWQAITGSDGKSVYFGDCKSDLRLRIYDKQKESKTDYKWLRLELQFRNEKASSYIMDPRQNGIKFVSVLQDYITYRSYCKDSNKRRWSVRKYWKKITEEAEHIRLYTDTSKVKCYEEVWINTKKLYSSSIRTIIEVEGSIDRLIEEAKKEKQLPEKYRIIINDVKEMLK